MPRVVAKEEALARLTASIPEGECAMCYALGRGDVDVLTSGDRVALLVNRFPLRWGHLLVVTKRHVTRFTQLEDGEHADAARLTLAAARALERVLDPARVYTASLGTALLGVPMSTPHLHWHVVPVARAAERPSEVLTWSAGVVEATDEEWALLRRSLESALPPRAT